MEEEDLEYDPDDPEEALHKEITEEMDEIEHRLAEEPCNIPLQALVQSNVMERLRTYLKAHPSERIDEFVNEALHDALWGTGY